MTDFDKLSANNEDGDVLVSVTEKKAPPQSAPVKKANIASVVLATIKRDESYFIVDGVRRLPDLKYTMLGLILTVIVVALALAMNLFVSYAMLIPIISFLFVIVPPLIILVFFYELNANLSIKLHVVAIAFLLGFFAYVLINFLSSFLYQFVAKEQIEQIGFPIVLALICFVDTLVLSSTFKTNRSGDCFLIAVAVMLGFCVTNNLVASFNKLFVTDGMIATATYNAPPGAGAIINTAEYLQTNYENLFTGWLFDYFIMPHLYACWATVIGFLASYAGESKVKERVVPKSVYLLLMLCAVMNVLAVIDTAIYYLEIILKAVAFIVSTFLEITFINLSLKEVLYVA